MISRQAVGRFVAALVGVEWLVLLIFGGLGLVFGPMALIAALVGGAWPRASAALLGLPVIFLAVSWVPLFFDRTGSLSLVDAAAILAGLTVPAIVAAALILAPRRGPEKASS